MAQSKNFLNSVDSGRFLNWYFSDVDDLQNWADNLLEELRVTGKVSTSTQSIYDSCGYIPQHICNNSDGQNEYHPSQVELIHGK